MARPESGKRVMGWAAAATLLAAAPLMAACSGGSHSSSASPSSSASHSSGPSPSADASENSGASSGDGGSSAQAGGQSTVPSAVEAWVSAVIEKDAKQACLLSTVPGSGSSPKAATPQTCNASARQKMAPGLKSMSEAFSPRDASGKPTVKVDAPTPKGDEAAVPTAKITVDGKPLRAIMLSRSHGVDPKSFTAKVETAKVNGKWYIGDFDMDSGHQTLRPQGQ
ncbi:hypothetical protein [Streptomyces sp. 5-10]|uniref:hypothetical protein n=1 Tax=Streptomyces sp. 5-10 TaxID=878925 RepID=UPI00168A57F0|nr:hypothetical protein [Streptomyces sp. 5-10]MBD3008410.1 hypothetical protein [Streptomyces sp. 5-10]